MQQDRHYPLPLAPDLLVRGQVAGYRTLKESVYQHIYLLMVTPKGSHRYDPQYGCAVWDHDFSLISSLKWKDLVRESMEESIRHFEPRLAQVRVAVEPEEFEVMEKENRYVRKRIGVLVEGVLRRTNEPFLFHEKIFIAPMSSD